MGVNVGAPTPFATAYANATPPDLPLNDGAAGMLPAENLYARLPQGIVTTSVDQLFQWARKSSLWPMTFGLACCAIEMISTFMAKHDLDR